MTPVNHIPAGTLVFHGEPTQYCDKSSPNCATKANIRIGEDLDNMQTLNGVYEVRDWISLAKGRGGWVAYYWKDKAGNILPKYAYIKGVPNKNILIAAGFFARTNKKE